MKDNLQESSELLEMMKQGFGKVRTEEEIEDDLDRAFKEKMKREAERQEQERLYRERLAKEQEEIRQAQYHKYKEIFDFIKNFNVLDEEDYYCIVELKSGEQFMAKPTELKRDEDYIMFYIQRNVGASSMWENPYRIILETNVNEVKGLQLKEEIKQEVVIIKKSKFGVIKG